MSSMKLLDVFHERLDPAGEILQDTSDNSVPAWDLELEVEAITKRYIKTLK